MFIFHFAFIDWEEIDKRWYYFKVRFSTTSSLAAWKRFYFAFFHLVTFAHNFSDDWESLDDLQLTAFASHEQVYKSELTIIKFQSIWTSYFKRTHICWIKVLALESANFTIRKDVPNMSMVSTIFLVSSFHYQGFVMTLVNLQMNALESQKLEQSYIRATGEEPDWFA